MFEQKVYPGIGNSRMHTVRQPKDAEQNSLQPLSPSVTKTDY